MDTDMHCKDLGVCPNRDSLAYFPVHGFSCLEFAM